MVEGGDHLGLSLEQRQSRPIGGHRLGQHLEGDLAIELGVERAVDLAHPSLGELRLDLVVGDPLPGQRGAGPAGAAPRRSAT